MQSTKPNDDVSVMGRFTQNILQWNENDIKSSQTTNGDYFFCFMHFNYTGEKRVHLGLGLSILLKHARKNKQ